ncbi:hypothetical protein M9Y10_013254 [Tritrichomonas musculus]|uniref:Uncharacterized protein n=1 Tax=Tritrichomonas musculus TaxID=1915356 RepID=A0ABR2I7U0_9EUKA
MTIAKPDPEGKLNENVPATLGTLAADWVEKIIDKYLALEPEMKWANDVIWNSMPLKGKIKTKNLGFLV